MYQVIYKNEGKNEKTPVYETRKEAEETAEFLKFQGATNVRIIAK